MSGKKLLQAAVRWPLALMLALMVTMVSMPQAAYAAPSPYCSTQTLTVTNGGSVISGNLASCDGPLNIGMVPAAAATPLHGTISVSPQSGPGNQTVTYIHNGNSATSDTFGLEDEDGNILTFNVTINPATSAIVVAPASLPALTAGTAFTQNLTSTGGTAPYSYSLSAGAFPVGVTMTGAGALSGTPTQRGAYNFSVRSQDAVGAFTVKGYTGTVANPTLSIAPTSATATQGVAFSQALSASGGVAPHTYLLETGSFPAGISISSAGVISGTTVAAPGSFPVTLRVTDSSTGPGQYFEVEPFTLNVVALPSVSISVSPSSTAEDGATNLTYTVTRSATSTSALTVNLTTGGTASSSSDYSGAVSSITIPANATTATVTINPTADLLLESNETVILTVAAGAGYTVGAPASATGTIANDETSSPGGTSTYCSAPLSATVANGGSIQINVSACDGPFDGGMSNGGVLNPVNGSYVIGPNSGGVQFVTYAHNGNSATTDRFELLDNANGVVTINITIAPPTSSIVVAPVNLPALTAGVAFSQTLTSTGGTGSYTYSLDSGTLIPGTTLSPSGVLSGTPTQRGNYAFSVRSQDSLGAFSIKAYNGSVAVPSLTLNPNSATAAQGAAFSQALTTTGGVAPYSYALETGSFPAGITISSAGVISGTTSAAAADYAVTLRVTDSSTGPGSYFELEPFTLTVAALPNVSIAVAPASVAEDGATNLVYTVTRSATSTSALTVNLTSGGTATTGTDYTGFASTMTIPANATTATVVIDPTADGTVEANETVTLNVVAGAGYTIGAPASATGTILNDDVPSASIAVAPASVAEDGAPNLVYTVTLSQTPLVATSVNFTVSGTATSGTDYAAVTSPLIISAGSTTGTIVINPTADVTLETDETAILTLAAGAGYTVGVPNSATGTILTDDLPSLSINDVTLSEGNAGTTNATFTVSLSAPAGPGGVTFDITTANADAIGGVDYVTRTLAAQTIPAGSSTYSFTVLVNGDLLNETNEIFFVNATNVTNAVVANSRGTGTIVNDDALPTVSVNSVSVFEGNSGSTSLNFEVSLSAASGQTVSVNIATASGTAISGSDYDPITATGTLSLLPGETRRTISIAILADTVPEPDETFTFLLSNPVNATIGTGTGTGTIRNDDVSLTIAPATLPNATAAAPYSQTLSVTGGTAPYAYTLTAGTLPAGLTLNNDVLSGTPTEAGSFNITIGATDSSGTPGPHSASRAYTLVVAAPALSLTPAAGNLPAPYGVPFTQDFVASGGMGPYTYTATGTIPPGMTFSGNRLSGTPTATNSYSLTITATDTGVSGSGSPFRITQIYTIVVPRPAITMTPAILPNPAIATSYSQSISAANGVAPYSYSVTAGALPSGIALSSGGTFFGTPTAGGTFTFTVMATDTNGQFGYQDFTLTVPAAVVTLPATSLPSGVEAAAYDVALNPATGGTAPYLYTLAGGALPPGLSLSAAGRLSGTPIAFGTYNFSVRAADSSRGTGPYSATQSYTMQVGQEAPVVNSVTYNTTYNAGATNVPLSFSGGFADSVSVVTQPTNGVAVASGRTITFEPNPDFSGTNTFTYTATNSAGTSAPATVTVTVSAPTISIVAADPLTATIGQTYRQDFFFFGGTQPFSNYQVTGLPAGLSITRTGTYWFRVSGRPTQAGSFTLSVSGTDSSTGDGPFTTTETFTLDVAAPALVLAPAATSFAVNFDTPISQQFSVTGGTGPYTYAVTGALPNGITFSSSGLLSGRTVSVGTFNFTITATDTGSTGAGAPFTVSNAYSLVVAAPTVLVAPSSLSGATVGNSYSETISASGGLAPYSYSITAGTLPSGLSFSPAGAISGTPTAGGTFNLTITATDNSSAPGPFSGNQSYSLVVAAPTVILPATTLAQGQVRTGYNATIAPATGGTAPYSYAVTAGALPAGVSLSASGTLSGTPSAFGTSNFTVTATDSSTGSGPYTATQSYTLSIIDQPPVAGPVSVNRTYGSASAAVPLNLSGGAATSVAIGTGPANGSATISGLTISYQPNASFSGTDSFTYTATNAGGTSSPATVTVTVGAPTLTITATNPLTATVGQAYSQTFSFTGGTGPFGSYNVTGLPAGLSLTGSSGNDVTIGGSPSAQGTFALTVSGTDASTGTGPFSVSQTFSLAVAGPNLVLAPNGGSFTAPYATAYSQGFTVSGGVGPYRYALTGSLPAGVTLNTATGIVSGTPTASGSFAFTVTATDTGATGSGAPFSVAGNYTLTVAAPAIIVTPTALPTAIAGQNYAATLTASGAVGPYSYTLTGGALPTGITLAANGQLSGISSVSGAFAFIVQVRDANGQTGTANLTLNVGVPTLTVTPTTLPTAVQGIAYSQTLTASGGIAPYSFAVTTGALPAGLVLNTGTGVISGTPTASGTANFAITVSDSTGGTPARLTVNFALQVTARPDPALDPQVRGLVQAQVAATRRFADAQVDNFMQRMESMHGESSGEGNGDGPGFSFRNNVRFSTPDYCRDAITMTTSAVCENRSRLTGIVPLNNWRADGSTSENGENANAGSGGSGSGGPVTIWAGGAIRFGEHDGESGRVSQEFESEGITIGADYRFSPSFAAGVGIGLGRDTVDVGDEGSQSRGEAKTVALYASHQFGKGVFIDWLVGYQKLDFDLRRYVTLTGALVNSQRSGDQWFGTMTAGADIERGNWQLTPYARLDITRARLNGYSENSGSVFDLAFLDQDIDFTSIGAGARFKYRHKTTWGELLPQLRAEYQWNVERSADARVTYTDRISSPFSNISLAGIGREELTLGGKLEMLFVPDWAMALEYIGRFSSGAGTDNMIQIGIKHEF